jgi:2'-5' RNA ligase
MARVRGMHGKRLDDAIGRVESLVVRVLGRIARSIASLVGGSPSAAALSDDDLQVIRREWTTAVGAELVPALSEAYLESATVLAKEFADAGRPVDVVSLEAPAAADFLDAATNRLVAVSDTLWEVARRELADGVRAGEGIEELATRLQQAGAFGEARARTIARTEVVAAANASSLAQALRLGDPSMTKTWEDADDDRVRPAHAIADGQTVPVGEPFEVGGEALMYPGQPTGSAGNVINERCTQVYGWGDVDEPLTAAAPDEFHLPGQHDQSEHGKDGPNAPDSAARRTTSGGGDTAGSGGRDRTSVGETVRKYGSKSLTLAVHDDGQLSLADSDGNKVRLSRPDVEQLRTRAIYSYEMDVGDEFTITHTEDRSGAPYSTLRMLVQKTAAAPEGDTDDDEETYRRDTLAVHLAPNDDPDFDELRATPPVEMTAEELADLAEALTDLTNAGRIDTGHGQVDMFSDGRSFVLRPVDGPELRLNRRGFRALDRALDGVVDDFADDEGSRSGGPLGEDATAERTVDTNLGQVTVSLRGGLGAGDMTIRVPDHDVEIVVAPAQQSAFLRQLGLLSEVLTASAARRKGVAMPAVVPEQAVVTAAAEVHTGAMVALRPSAADAERLAVEGGEPGGQLHTTLAYLGAAADIPVEARERIIDAVFDIAEGKPPLTVEGFAVSVFNPGDTNDRDPCIVLGLSGDGLDDIHGHVAEALLNLQSEPAGFTLPEQHTPWQPHITLIYTDDVSMVEKLADRVGPVTFDAIRVAFGGEVFDIPLGQPEPDDDGDEELDEDFDWSAYLAEAIQAQFQSRMPPQLQAYWIRKLRLGTKGSFRRCVRELREHFPEDTEGLCANLYHTATGRWPGRKKDNASADGNLAVEPETVAVDVVEEPATEGSLEALPGEHFHTRVLEGVSTGMRQFAPGSITWRTPPFAYHWQWKSSAHNGLPETIQVGLVTRAVRDDPDVHFWGRLDLRSPEGLDYARRLVEGFARWSSVGGDESVKDRDIDVEYVLDVEPADPTEDPEINLMTFGKFRVAEISGVSVPALADATVEPTQELIDTLTAMGVIEPAQVASEPPAVEEIQEDEVADFAAVRPHDTPTVGGEWDAGANEKRLPSPLPVTDARAEYAWIDDTRIEGDHVPKDACSFPHHEVSGDGRPGAANVDAVRNALARLSQSDVPESDREAVHAHLARHLRDAGGNPSDFDSHGPSVVVASGRTITLPEAPPAAWFDEPADGELPPFGSVRVDSNGRLVGLLAPAQVNHRSFPGKRVKVPMGRVDYSGWQNKSWTVAEGHSVNVGVITMDCGHASTSPGDWSYSHRREHYDNTCSIAAHARAYEKPGIGVALAGAIAPWLDAEGFQKLLSADLSGDWPPHPDKPGWRDFCAALAVPVGGFPNRARLRLAEGQLVAAAVPVHFDDDVEALVEIEEMNTVPLAEGTRVRIVDPRDPEVTEGEIVMVHMGPAYALMVPGRDEPHRWYVAEEIEPVGDTDEPDEVEDMVASAGPDLRPALERVAKSVGLDARTRMESLRSRVHVHN